MLKKGLISADYKNVKIIGFDADDTLWVNEPYYRETEKEFCILLEKYQSHKVIIEDLYNTEIKNLELYGYGTKAFVLSLIETAIEVSKGKLTATEIKTILSLGKKQIQKTNELIDGVDEVLNKLCTKYPLIIATKGDLLDQERKLANSGLTDYFHHIEIMSNKTEGHYKQLINHLNISPSEFLMIGNSLKSDILPVINIGSNAIHIPYHITWQHEMVDETVIKKDYIEVSHISDVLKIIPL